MENRPEFLKDVFQHEDKYSYLIKEWDSSDEDYKYHVKIFRIDYELFNDKFEKINMSEFSKGIYIIQLINNQSIINHKIILQ